MSSYFDHLIIGGGIIGLSTALALHQRGHQVALLDAGDLTTAQQAIPPRVYALNLSSMHLFKTLGVWDDHAHAPYQKMHIWDAANTAQINFDARTKAMPALGSMVVEASLKQQLLTAIHMAKIPCFANVHIKHIAPHADGVLVSDDLHSWTTKLLIGTDGKQSIVRQKFNVPVTQWSYQQQAIITTVQTEYAHQQTAYQVFHHDGPLAFLPLTDPNTCSIVWSVDLPRAAALMALSQPEFELALTQAFSQHLGVCTLLHPRQVFPLHMRHVQQYHGNNWLLMGDAAHTIHPLAGLGLNVGLADLSTWLHLLDTNPTRPLTAVRTLSAYQRQRKHALWQTIILMQSLKTVFMSQATPIVYCRSLGMQACEQFGILKRLMIDYVS